MKAVQTTVDYIGHILMGLGLGFVIGAAVLALIGLFQPAHGAESRARARQSIDKTIVVRPAGQGAYTLPGAPGQGLRYIFEPGRPAHTQHEYRRYKSERRYEDRRRDDWRRR